MNAVIARREGALNATYGGFQVRTATVADVPVLAELDRVKFGTAGMDVYGEDHFRCWLEINPTGLLVISHGGTIVGYRYSQYLDFSLEDIGRLTDNDAFTDSGYTRQTHKLDGNSINGVSVCSNMKGAGRVLFEVIFDQLRREGRRFYFGFSRIPGFAAYLDALAASKTDVSQIGLKDLATWYALGCAKKIGGLVHNGVRAPEGIALPEPTEPDPVLSRYLKHAGFGIAAVLPNWIKDPCSKDVGIMVLYKNPDLVP